ncbi:MAG TPA: twin-arginine translocase TatA/TatE family subunit [Solirubrobacteraceae bacterium]|nr:twin-arginine translocase TatA/TatE family subunit [Solirubrobacteraceae bacterium]
MSFISPVHIAFFAAIALLALGPKRFPEFTKTLGHTLREFREVVSGATSAVSVDRADAAEPPVAATPVPAPPPAPLD